MVNLYLLKDAVSDIFSLWFLPNYLTQLREIFCGKHRSGKLNLMKMNIFKSWETKLKITKTGSDFHA